MQTLLSETCTAWKESIFGVILVHISPHSDWIRRDTLRIRSEYGKMQTRITPNTDSFHTVLYWRIPPKRVTHLELGHRNLGILERTRHIAKSNCVIQLNYGDVCTDARCKLVIRWERSNTEEWNCFSFQTNYDSCNSTSFVSEDSVFKCHLIKKDRNNTNKRYKKERSFLPLHFH